MNMIKTLYKVIKEVIKKHKYEQNNATSND